MKTESFDLSVKKFEIGLNPLVLYETIKQFDAEILTMGLCEPISPLHIYSPTKTDRNF